MKYLLTSVLLLAQGQALMAQCLADAGPDTVLCGDLGGAYDALPLGGDPIVIGGTAPFTYAWSTFVDLGWGGWVASASDMMDDTTLAHPLLVDPYGELWYTLTVTDSAGITCIDSVFVGLSGFGTTLGYVTATIMEGDSFLFNFGTNISGYYEPLTYVWHPNESLSDSTSLTSWAFPTESTVYSLTATDAVGCTVTASPLYFVTVIYLGTDEQEAMVNGAQVHPALVCDGATITAADRSRAYVVIYEPHGAEVLRARMHDGAYYFDATNWRGGAYFFKVVDGSKTIGSGRFVVE